MMERIFDLIDILRKPERVTAIIREELLAIREPTATNAARPWILRATPTSISAI